MAKYDRAIEQADEEEAKLIYLTNRPLAGAFSGISEGVFMTWKRCWNDARATSAC